MFGLTLDWHRCPDGVELVPAPDPDEWFEDSVRRLARRTYLNDMESDWIARQEEFIARARAEDGIEAKAQEWMTERIARARSIGASITEYTVDEYLTGWAKRLWENEVEERAPKAEYLKTAREQQERRRWQVPGARFDNRSRRLVPARYDLSSLEDPIAIHFINARTDESMGRFLGRYGMLGSGRRMRKPDQSTTPIRDSIYVAEAEGYRCTIDELMREAGSGDGIRAIAALNEVFERPARSPSTSFGRMHLVMPHLDLPPGHDTPRLAIRPFTLISYMVLEAATVAASGARLTTCEHCGKAFLTGPLTGRRGHAKYCSDRCRVAAMRKRNAAAKAPSD